ncbi:MAG: hypothetical protein ABI415_10265, partial [Flavitalea sp.]
PLTIDRVKKIKFDNSKNIIPQELEPAEVTSSKPKEIEPEFVDLVGQISLKTLDKAEKKKRQGGPPTQQKRDNNNNNRDNRPQQRSPNRQNTPPPNNNNKPNTPPNNIDRRPKK